MSRFKDIFEELNGVDVNEIAIQKGKIKYPFIHFLHGSADNLDKIIKDPICYDVIILNDVIYYFNEKKRNKILKWIFEHIKEDGLVFIAGWAPGGRYLIFDEMKKLVQKYFRVETEQLLESKHAVFVLRKKKYFIAVTIDYETWHPIPEGKSINWDNDVFNPTNKLLDLFDQQGIKLTLMAEMGEYFWLKDNKPEIAVRMEEQWADAVRRGHDVQIHLHPNWLPELGAKCENGKWKWDWSKSKANDYPGDLKDLIKRCKTALESILCKIRSDYSVTSFRAGAYGVQPFKRLYDALISNNIVCDTSVYLEGVSAERGYDFRLACSDHQPYFANAYDPQLKAPPSENKVIEIPIFTYKPNKRCFLDNDNGKFFADHLLDYFNKEDKKHPSSESYRRNKYIRRFFSKLYSVFRKLSPKINLMLPKCFAHFMADYPSETLVDTQYFVLIGHTKSNLHFDEILENLCKLKKDNRLKFVTLSEMASMAKNEILANTRKSAEEEAAYQVKREFNAVMGDSRNNTQSYHLQDMIPMDRGNVLDLGCGAGYWSKRISQLYPWMQVKGVDYGIDFIKKANENCSSEKVSFCNVDFSDLGFPNNCFDCVYADNSLEHCFDVDKTLSEICRVLRFGGVLVAAIPSDAYNPTKICDNHTWKTAPHEVRMRLHNAGFVNVEIEEVDTFRKLGMPPYPPSNDKMMYIRAWKRKSEITKFERAKEIMNWLYHSIEPKNLSDSDDPAKIISDKGGYCWRYSVSLGKLLQKEGTPVKWLSMFSKGHLKGRGVKKIDSHEVVSAEIDGKEMIFDCMANKIIPFSLKEILKTPSLAGEKELRDERYNSRDYYLYDTSYWYSRVFKYAYRSDVNKRIYFWKKNKFLNQTL